MRRTTPNPWLICALLPVALCATAAAQQQPADPLDGWLRHLERSVPRAAAQFRRYDTAKLAETTSAIEQWAAHIAHQATLKKNRSANAAVGRLLAAKSSVDDRLDAMLALRTEFAALDADQGRHAAARALLRTTSLLIDLSGRLRYLLSDAVNFAAAGAANDQQRQEELVDMITAARSSIGAAIMSRALVDVPASGGRAPPKVSPRLKTKLLRMIAAAGEINLLPAVAELARAESTPPELIIAAAETIRQVGLPQDPRPGQGDDVPRPAMTAAQLLEVMSRIDATALPSDLGQRHEELVVWLQQRRDHGILGDSLRLGHFDVRPGDWLLMRNPSPYNLFTDLSPGLFTHVGVVGMEENADGYRRLVLVDLPEIGDRMPATNVDLFVLRSLHYVFVRHPDPEVGRKMGEVAVSMIGNPTEFDLNFRTDRVAALRGQPLQGKKITTYCAGLLLLCSQETTAPREEFFPLPETVAGGNTAANLALLGLSIGDGFVSPTGALFSPSLEIVGRRQPMYEPEREIREAIYDYFAQGLETKRLVPSPNEKQAMLIRLAEMAEGNPLLAAAIAKSQGVSADMDLVSAAKAAAVVETLDEIAYDASDGFFDARWAIRAPAAADLSRQGYPREDIRHIGQLRSRHARVYQQWRQGSLSPRELRVEMVHYYIEQGQTQLDRRFFQVQPTTRKKVDGSR